MLFSVTVVLFSFLYIVLTVDTPGGLSRRIHLSLAGRDSLGPWPTTDTSWLHEDCARHKSVLNVGQIVNNAPEPSMANVAYVELTVPVSHLNRRFLPYAHYEPLDSDAPKKVVALVATRDIHCDEELYSNYFSLVS